MKSASCVYWKIRYKFMTWSYAFSARWFAHSGITKEKRNPELIVSLTSFPARIPTLHLCIETLLQQTIKPDRIILWLSKSEILPEELPASLTRLEKRGLEIKWCKNTRSYRKLIPTLHDYPDALIVTADDDIFYPKTWLEQLYTAYQKEPEYIHCHRAHLIKYSPDGNSLPYLQWGYLSMGIQGPSLDIIPTGVGGVLYASNHLNSEIMNEQAFLELCPKADDIWFKAMSLLNNVQCKKVSPYCFPLREINIKNNKTLSDDNYQRGENDSQIDAVAARYGVFKSSKIVD